MIKREIVDSVSVQTGMQRKDLLVAFNLFMSEIKKSLERGEAVYIRGFGTFKVVTSAAKKARDIGRNKVLDIPPKKTVRFQPCPDFKERVGELNV